MKRKRQHLRDRLSELEERRVSRRAGMTQIEAKSAWRLSPVETEAGGSIRGTQRPR